MRKNNVGVLELPRVQKLRSQSPKLIVLAFAVVLSPFLYESGLLIFARWKSVVGPYSVPRTPLIDTLELWSRDAGYGAGVYFRRVLDSGPWSPAYAVPFGIAWALAMAIIFLKRVR